MIDLLKQLLETVLGQRVSDLLRVRVRARRMKSGTFTESEITFLELVLREGDVAFDAGAYAGEYSYKMSQLVGDSGKVFAIEAFPRHTKLLRSVLEKLKVDNVEIIPEAVANEVGELQLTHASSSGRPLTGEVHLTQKGDLSTGSILVPVTTIDQIYAGALPAPCVRLLKIDIEGAERWAIAGASRVLDTCRPVIICEIEDRHCQRYGHTRRDVISDLLARRYRAFSWQSEIQSLSPWNHTIPNPNVIFVHESDQSVQRLLDS